MHGIGDDRILAIIPAYNEEESILKVVEDLERNAPYADYIVLNDGSTDGTRAVLEESGIPHIDLIRNLGIGGAVQTGYKYALEQGYDIAVQFDGDGQHCAEYISSLIAPIQEGEADLVIGSRFATYSPDDYPEPESLALVARKGLKLAEVPVSMRERLGGESSIKRMDSVYYMIKVTFAILIQTNIYERHSS